MPTWKKEKAKEMRENPTKAEAALWERLKERRIDGFKFRRQAPLYGWIADFWCPSERVVIEVDGGYHATRKDEDALRDRVLAEKDIRVLRLTNEEVLDHLEPTIQAIREVLGVSA